MNPEFLPYVITFVIVIVAVILVMIGYAHSDNQSPLVTAKGLKKIFILTVFMVLVLWILTKLFK